MSSIRTIAKKRKAKESVDNVVAGPSSPEPSNESGEGGDLSFRNELAVTARAMIDQRLIREALQALEQYKDGKVHKIDFTRLMFFLVHFMRNMFRASMPFCDEHPELRLKKGDFIHAKELFQKIFNMVKAKEWGAEAKITATLSQVMTDCVNILNNNVAFQMPNDVDIESMSAEEWVANCKAVAKAINDGGDSDYDIGDVNVTFARVEHKYETFTMVYVSGPEMYDIFMEDREQWYLVEMVVGGQKQNVEIDSPSAQAWVWADSFTGLIGPLKELYGV